MHIKQIIIQGFKSYKDQTVIEPFSPKHNVIVGRNGSGKSNFFAAIRFVLSDAYTQMGREERQALLHEGSGSAVMSAYVEVIFDNTDSRFPTGRDELILRRTIGQKKDEYSLDRKNSTKADVMNLLESAGFSRSNPYYIVPQGRVTTLTNMKDGERLNLLKEVAGTQVYESRRTESLKIVTETDNKRAKIDDLLAYIRERLDELEEEKEELRAFQEKDRERRCLEYTIYHREQEEITAALEQLDEARQTGVDETDENRQRFLEGEEEIKHIDNQINELKQQIDFLAVDKQQLEEDRKEAAREKAKIELDVKGLSDGQSAAQQASTRYANDLAQVQSQIQQREAELEELIPQYNAQKEQEAAAKLRLTEAEGQQQRLYAKQGRSVQFKTKRERDTFLRREIEEVNVASATRKAVAMQTTEDIADLEGAIGSLEVEIEGLRNRIDSRGDESQTHSADVQRAKEERDTLDDQRKDLWREEAKLNTIIQNAQQELEKAERFLSHMMDRNTSRGVAAVRRISRQHNIPGVYGTLAELFEYSDKYKTAIEVTAGNSLFHVVVDTDATATRVLEILQREKAGRVTFMPLNRLNPKPANIPKANDAVHLITKIQYDAQYDKAFQQVFGKTIVCPNLQIAAQYARSHSVGAITPEGDRADKKGALTGGFHDPRSSRLDGVRNVSKWREQYEDHRARGAEIRRQLEALDQQITRAMSNLQKAEQTRQQAENGYGPLRNELRSKTTELQSKRDELEKTQAARDNVELAVHQLGEQGSFLEAELRSDFKKALTAEEERQLETLSATIQTFRKQYSDLSSARSELEGRKSILEVELRENLRLRLDQLQAQEADSGNANTVGSSRNRLNERRRELKRAKEALATVISKLAESDSAIDEAQTQLNQAQTSHEEKMRQQEDLARLIARHKKLIEKSAGKRAVLNTRGAEVATQIRNLGVLPDAAFSEPYMNMAYDKAMKRLHKVSSALKGYGHVNKKAFEQYNSFTRQRESLESRRSELGSSLDSIKELIDVLDQRKDEAIERTFRQVSKEFARIFEKLVPAGKGRLIIQRKTDRVARGEEEEESDDDGEGRKDGVENYTGVGISVSFNSKHDEQQRIQQLSGGQKSLCALALVFAIQASDPAPFYLFDEIDANLDAQYRTAVANMLAESSEHGQFICTTFRPEMLLVAEKCYGVSYINKTSSIDVVSREQALDFVEGQIKG
ncbi:hypothetical protein MBLNU459_g8275t1 [Dothideomycetes sp. NU459]